jgi:enoyl-CoA hydratase
VTVAVERRGHVLVVRMQRATKRNAIDADMTAGLDDALNTLDDDPELWAGVVTGDGRVFSAGTDLAGGSGPATPRGGFYGVVRRRRTTPLVAAVEGLALGGGFEIALACDLIVAARDARFGLPEVTRGVMATSGAMFRAPRALPLNVAREMLLVGDPLGAERMWSLGVVNQLTEPGAALEAAVAVAERICANSPSSVRTTLQALEQIVAVDDDDGWTATEQGIARIMDSEDLKEGVAAFLEKRAPRWVNR